MQERRSEQRQRVLFGGSISYNYGAFSTECTVRNFSPKGALVLVSGAVPFPEEVDLRLNHTGLIHQVRVMWRIDDRMGVLFTIPEPTNVVPLDLVRQLRREFSGEE